MSKIKSLPTLNSNIKTTFTETTKKNNKVKLTLVDVISFYLTTKYLLLQIRLDIQNVNNPIEHERELSCIPDN